MGKQAFRNWSPFSWLNNPLFILGKQKPLEQAEVPAVNIKDSTELLSQSNDNDLTSVKEKYGLRNSSIYRTIFIFIRKKVAINACFAVVSASAFYVGPSLIDNFVKCLGGSRDHGLKTGYFLALAFLSAKFVETGSEAMDFWSQATWPSLKSIPDIPHIQKGPSPINPGSTEPYQWRNYQLHERGYSKNH